MTQPVGNRENYEGNLTLTAPVGGVVKGGAYQIGNSLVVALETAAAAAPFLAAVDGPVSAAKEGDAGSACVAGVNVYLDGVNPAVSGDDTSNAATGAIALEAAADGDTSVTVLLHSGGMA